MGMESFSDQVNCSTTCSEALEKSIEPGLEELAAGFAHSRSKDLQDCQQKGRQRWQLSAACHELVLENSVLATVATKKVPPKRTG